MSKVRTLTEITQDLMVKAINCVEQQYPIYPHTMEPLVEELNTALEGSDVAYIQCTTETNNHTTCVSCQCQDRIGGYVCLRCINTSLREYEDQIKELVEALTLIKYTDVNPKTTEKTSMEIYMSMASVARKALAKIGEKK